jgi:hypothetical protein
MADYDPRALEHWREHPQDFVLIYASRGTSLDILPPDSPIHYYIHNMAANRGYHIEDGQIRRALVEEMMAAGVRTVTFKEGWKILNPRIFAELSEANDFEKFWQANYPYDVD